MPIAINTIAKVSVSGSQMSLTNSGSKYGCRGNYKNVPGKTNNYTAKTILPVAINAIATLQNINPTLLLTIGSRGSLVRGNR